MEMPAINIAKFNGIIEGLLLCNQRYNSIFPESNFSEYITKILRNNFFDYIHLDAFTAVCKVHIKQENHVAIC